MESSIASHLKCPRSLPRRIEDDFSPPYPCWSARADASVDRVVMAYFGVQSKGAAMQGRACAALVQISKSFAVANGPGHHDLAHYVDEAGHDNMIAIAYWSDPEAFAAWQATPEVANWWDDPARLTEGLGYFRELLTPHMAHYETMFNTPDRLEGIGVVMGGISDTIQEHSYWGSARDRIPLAQTDRLVPSGTLRLSADSPAPGQRVKVAGHAHVAVIRSGQEWADTDGKERELYLQDMEPTLREGMDFLRDQGNSIGCYTNRYMRHVDSTGRPTEKSFGLSYWHSLADMERWSESHPTHVEIFGAFMRYVQALNFQVKLRVYHEVTVLKPEEQSYEYINCHPKTGLMNGLQR